MCTNDELIEAVRRKQKYSGIAEAIISGKDHIQPIFDAKNVNEEDLLAMLNFQAVDPNDKKQQVRFNLPDLKKKDPSSI
jgi:hypothetical protein